MKLPESIKTMALGATNPISGFKASVSSGDSGCCVHRIVRKKPLTLSITAPDGDHVDARVIRWHELMHSKYSGHSLPNRSRCEEFTEDMIIHMVQHGGSFTHLAPALIEHGKKTVEMYPETVGLKGSEGVHARLVFIRGLSLLLSVALRMNEGDHATEARECVEGIQESLDDAFTPKFWAAVGLRMAAAGFEPVTTVKSLVLGMHIHTHTINMKRDNLGKRGKKAINLFKYHKSICTFRRFCEAFVLDTPVEYAHSPSGTMQGTDAYRDTVGAGSEISGVRYGFPPLTSMCTTVMALGREAGMSGSTVVASRLASVPTGNNRVFWKRRKAVARPPTAFMLDLSGSMKWTDELLKEVCSILPKSTVYGYSDYRSGGSFDGEIALLASRGRRVETIERKSSGNGCDLQAVQKLLSHPGPVVFVSDLGFCGQSELKKLQAFKMVGENSAPHGRLTLCKSVYEAMAYIRTNNKTGWR